MEEKKILVVDDDKNICELLDLYLANEGFTLFFTHDGSSALNILKEQEIDLVLLNVMLPVINGWEVCKIIRKYIYQAAGNLSCNHNRRHRRAVTGLVGGLQRLRFLRKAQNSHHRSVQGKPACECLLPGQGFQGGIGHLPQFHRIYHRCKGLCRAGGQGSIEKPFTEPRGGPGGRLPAA